MLGIGMEQLAVEDGLGASPPGELGAAITRESWLRARVKDQVTGGTCAYWPRGWPSGSRMKALHGGSLCRARPETPAAGRGRWEHARKRNIDGTNCFPRLRAGWAREFEP